jgi:hypothetical protein
MKMTPEGHLTMLTCFSSGNSARKQQLWQAAATVPGAIGELTEAESSNVLPNHLKHVKCIPQKHTST